MIRCCQRKTHHEAPALGCARAFLHVLLLVSKSRVDKESAALAVPARLDRVGDADVPQPAQGIRATVLFQQNSLFRSRLVGAQIGEPGDIKQGSRSSSSIGRLAPVFDDGTIAIVVVAKDVKRGLGLLDCLEQLGTSTVAAVLALSLLDARVKIASCRTVSDHNVRVLRDRTI